MKKEYKTPLTEVVFLSIGQLLQEAQAGTTDSTGDTDIFNANNSSFEEEETVDIQGKKSLWED